ncbi:MAG: hypothetical protein DSM106950_18155 [Stigonema ocellatum SAG 48.90 = DSM 106950]|nr:hypothetical protein [Stigonema ocellatum SAG 48.90 = DSM 106950]
MRLSLVISIFLSLLLCWNAPVMALPLTFAQVQPVQTLLNSNQENVVENFTKSTNFTEANSFELSGGEVQVSYSSTSFSGVPLLNYRDNNINLNFSGQQIRVLETELGQLITVTLEEVSDESTVTFTLILPLVNLNTGSETIRIKVPGIKTTTRTTIAGPGPGAEKTYTTVNLRGTAKFILS